MTQEEINQLTIGSSVWCVHPSYTYLFETRVTEMRVFNINKDEPDEPIELAIEYTLEGVGCELPYSQDGKWFVYDGELDTECMGEQECYYISKDNATLSLLKTLRMLAESYLEELENKYL